MTPLPIIGDTLRVALQWTDPVFPRKSVNVMHFHSVGYAMSTFWTALDANVTALMWGHTGTNSQIDQVTIIPLDGGGAGLIQATGGPAKWRGTDSSNVPIPQASAIVKLTTGTRGRSNRGRVYLPWVNEDIAAAGQLDATRRSAMNGAWATFRSAMLAAGFPLVVASYKHSTALNVLATDVEAYLGTQRRRQPRP